MLLPLHRAVSGFHFHGNQRLVLKTLSVLIDHGASVNAVDHLGNTVLHKAIQVCTSAAVIPVIRYLVVNGADVNLQNGVDLDQDTAITTEIKRLRSKSAKAIEVLLSHGADVNKHGIGLPSALTLALQAGQSRAVHTNRYATNTKSQSSTVETSCSTSGRNFWVPVVYLIAVTGKAQWDDRARQLELLLSGPEPPQKDWDPLLEVLDHVLQQGDDNDNDYGNDNGGGGGGGAHQRSQQLSLCLRLLENKNPSRLVLRMKQVAFRYRDGA